jgi:hypothetical protein
MPSVPIPAALLSVYAVPTCAPPADAVALAAEHLELRLRTPVRDIARQLLDRAAVRLDVLTAADFPVLESPWLGAFGADDAHLRAVRTATHVVVAATTFRPGAPLSHAWAARAVAHALGGALGAPVLDVFTPRLLDGTQLAASWPDADGRLPLARWVVVMESPDDEGYWCTTLGLGRFGLPELQSHAVAPRLRALWVSVLTGLAQRVLDIWHAELRGAGPRATDVQLPDTVVVSPADLTAAYGTEPGGRRTAEFRLLPERAGAPFLTVLGPPGVPALEHQAAVCRALFGVTDDVAAQP